jgi:hypothetical protein
LASAAADFIRGKRIRHAANCTGPGILLVSFIDTITQSQPLHHPIDETAEQSIFTIAIL